MTEYVEIKGKFKFGVNRQPKQWDDGDKWMCTISPDKDSIMTVMDLAAQGVKNTLKKDEEGYYITYSRPVEKTYKSSGKSFKFDPPKYSMADGTNMPDEVGSGSEGSAILEVYSHDTPTGNKAKAARLAEVKVSKLAEFGPKEDKNGWN